MRVATAAPLRVVRRRRPAPVATLTVRPATAADAAAIHALIAEHLDEGHLLPRERGEIVLHASRFVVACDGTRVVACADLAPLSRSVAEVRSLVVSEDARSLGAGRRMVDALVERASAAGFARLCAFTHAPGYFVQMGFSIVPHAWVPDKISTTCRTCAEFGTCGQYAVTLPLDDARGTSLRSTNAFVPLASLHA
jgi:amino-acid N-acetyltransferase